MRTTLSIEVLYLLLHLSVTLLNPNLLSASEPPCRNSCGSLEIKYPFGTGYGCGSPRFYPYVTCSHDNDNEQLVLSTHAGTYPVTTISYTTSTITIAPPYMSTCTSMKPSPNLGLDWASPLQVGPSTIILLHCKPPTSTLTYKGSLICDPSPSSSHLCSSIYTCPAVVTIGLPLFPPTNTCCVYSPANFNSKGDLDLQALKCSGYASVASLGDFPTDPTKWEYGVVLKYTSGALDSYFVDARCGGCEDSGGVCGYAPPSNSFVCVCDVGFNTTTNCKSNNQVDAIYWDDSASLSLPIRNFHRWLIVVFTLILAA